MICSSLAGAARAISPSAQCPVASRSPPCSLHGAALFTSPSRVFVSGGIVCKRPLMVTPAATAAAIEADAESIGVEVLDDSDKEILVAAAKNTVEKPRLVLKFIWMEKNIGLALDHVIPGHGAVPLSPYYFWPRKDAWEELKTLMESKPWISQKRMIILLNQATDIINLWQQSGAGSLQQ